MVSTKKNEDAVSPVIGVILMVAVTVILAAIIAAFVFGMAGNIQSTKVVAFTLQRNATPGTIVITFMGGQDSGKLSTTNWSVNNGVATTWVPANIGASTTVTGGGTAGTARVIGVGTFNDGTTQVLVEQTL